METKNTEINLDYRTRPVLLFSHQIHDLFESDCSRVQNRTNLLAAIMNLVSNSSSLYPAASLSPFLIGRIFLREPSWKYSAKLVGS